ncbi:MAG: ABC transporter permease [Candidatus Hydrogenedentes bacterium]|nr:ABC transporter permease [Candidatus Hydrogenedentota bacterium]
MGLFLNVFVSVATFSTYLHARRRRTWLIAFLIALPAFVPLLAAYNPSESPTYAEEIVDAVAQFLYVLTITPLMALVFGCSLFSEEIEARTLPLLLARAAPRSAIVLGKYAAFVFVSAILILVSFALTFASSAYFNRLAFADYLGLFARYSLLVLVALVAYGAFCVAMSTLTKHPVVVSALFIFGWEKLVAALPGYADFITLQKYVLRLLPEVTFNRIEVEKVELPPELMRAVYPVSGWFSITALAVASALFLALACYVVRSREYVTASGAG